jgi:hypothetical protein
MVSSRLSTSVTKPGLHLGDRAPRERAHDQLAHPCVQRRIVEHQTGGVVLEQGRARIIATIQLFNVGAERMLGYRAAEVLNRITPADIPTRRR